MKPHAMALEAVLLIILSTALLFLDVSYYVVMGLAIAVIAVLHYKEPKELGISKKRISEAIGAQLPFTMLAIIGLTILALANNYSIKPLRLEFLAYWMISVPMQEFLFRGFGQRVLRIAMPAVAAVFIASLLFSLSHYFIEVSEPLILYLSTFFAAFAWGMAYEKERNLIGPIVSHIILGTIILLILP